VHIPTLVLMPCSEAGDSHAQPTSTTSLELTCSSLTLYTFTQTIVATSENWLASNKYLNYRSHIWKLSGQKQISSYIATWLLVLAQTKSAPFSSSISASELEKREVLGRETSTTSWELRILAKEVSLPRPPSRRRGWWLPAYPYRMRGDRCRSP
jgi:hypothetical protein